MRNNIWDAQEGDVWHVQDAERALQAILCLVRTYTFFFMCDVVVVSVPSLPDASSVYRWLQCYFVSRLNVDLHTHTSSAPAYSVYVKCAEISSLPRTAFFSTFHRISLDQARCQLANRSLQRVCLAVSPRKKITTTRFVCNS